MHLDFLRQMNNYSTPDQNEEYQILHLTLFIKLSFIEQMQSSLLPTITEG